MKNQYNKKGVLSMEKQNVSDIIIESIKDYLETQDIQTEVNEDTALLGEKSILASMGLVNVIIDIESKFLDEGYEISLTSEKAMSRRNSPFRNIRTLGDFIYEQLEEDKNG